MNLKKGLTCATTRLSALEKLIRTASFVNRTFEEYEQEVESGLLTWSTPTHEDDDFWRENAKKMDAKNGKAIKWALSFVSVFSNSDAVCVQTGH